MVSVYMACCRADHYPDLFDRYQAVLPEKFIRRADCFRFREDSVRYLSGKILLMEGAKSLGHGGLRWEDFYLDEYSKPHFSGGLHFNISHSGDRVLCVISEKNKVGIDVEKWNGVDMDCFSRCFTTREWTVIQDAGSPLKEFYRLWTRKEAVIKADGRGMHLSLRSFDVLSDRVVVGNDNWYLKELAVGEGYCAHLATDSELAGDLTIQQLI